MASSLTPTPTPLPVRRVHVYEIVNRTRLASLLVISCEDPSALRQRLMRQPPEDVGRWNLLLDRWTVEPLIQSLPLPAAEEFLRRHEENMSRRTWRFHVWRP